MVRLSLRHPPLCATSRARRLKSRTGRGDHVRHGGSHRREHQEYDRKYGHEGGSGEGNENPLVHRLVSVTWYRSPKKYSNITLSRWTLHRSNQNYSSWRRTTLP